MEVKKKALKKIERKVAYLFDGMWHSLAPNFSLWIYPNKRFFLFYSPKSTSWWQFPNVLFPLDCCICCHLTVSFVCFLSMLATAYRTFPERKLHYYWQSSFHERPHLLFLLVLFLFFTHSSPGILPNFPQFLISSRGIFLLYVLGKGLRFIFKIVKINNPFSSWFQEPLITWLLPNLKALSLYHVSSVS